MTNQQPDDQVEQKPAWWMPRYIKTQAATITALRQRVAELEAENKHLISAWKKKHEQLVAEKQEASLWFTKAQEWKAAVLAEREACAKIVDDAMEERLNCGDEEGAGCFEDCAQAIRNRSNDHAD